LVELAPATICAVSDKIKPSEEINPGEKDRALMVSTPARAMWLKYAF